MSIGKKQHALREAWARVYNHIIPNKVSQGIDSLASTFEGWSYREIYMVYRYTLQSDSMHPNKKVSIVARWYCTYNTSTDTNAFSKVFS